MPPDPDIPSPATPTPAGAGGAPPPGPATPPEDPVAPEPGDRLKTRGYGFDKVKVRAIIERFFRIYEERDAVPGLDQAVLVAFFVMADHQEVEGRYPELQSELKRLDPRLMPVLRQEGGETIIVVTRRPEETRASASKLPQVLFIATVLTLTAAGSIAWISYVGITRLLSMLEPRYLGMGFLTFAVPLLWVFGVQEVARRVVAKRHDMRLGPSFLVPVPPFVFFPSIGTFGSVLHARDPWPSRKALFDVAATGPIAGFLAAVPVVVVGMLLTTATAVPVPDGGVVSLEIVAPDGRSWSEAELEDTIFDPFDRETPEDENRAHNVTVRFVLDVAGRDYGNGSWNASALGTGARGKPLDTTLTWSAFSGNGTELANASETGEVAPGGNLSLLFDPPAGTARLVALLEYAVPDRLTVPLGEPLAYRALTGLFDAEGDYVIHPVALAGWTAVLVIGVTLIPAGRLDGGSAARALFGDRMMWLSYLAVGGLAVLSFLYPGWVYLVLFIILFLGVRHPAPLNETTPLDLRRQLVAVLLLALLVVCFVPIPAELAARGF